MLVERALWHIPRTTLGAMHHRTLRAGLALCTLTALTFGCHHSEEQAPLDDARAGWHATETAIAAAGIGMQWNGPAGLDLDWDDAAALDPHGLSSMGPTSVPCPEGGSLKLDIDAQTSETLVGASVGIEFDGCGAEGVVIDGQLEYAAELSGLKLSTSMTGDLSFSGAAEGACEIDIGTSITWAGASSHRHLCGFEYDELFG